jgi:putative membrane protein
MAEVTNFEPGSGARRTRLAAERTLLAWWRTGLAALAVGVGIGRVVPELGDAKHHWPYVVLGILYALYGVALFWLGSRRVIAVDRALERDAYSELGTGAVTALTAVGVVLALLTVAVIAFG